MFTLGWGGILRSQIQFGGKITSWAYAGDGTLLLVRGKELMYLSEKEGLKFLTHLPSEGMEIVSANDEMIYIYETRINQSRSKKTSSLYAFVKNAGFQKIRVL